MHYETRTGAQMSTRKSHNTYGCGIEKNFNGVLVVCRRLHSIDNLPSSSQNTSELCTVHGTKCYQNIVLTSLSVR
jgi:hypothetical protein